VQRREVLVRELGVVAGLDEPDARRVVGIGTLLDGNGLDLV
jgi:hypothetical protein